MTIQELIQKATIEFRTIYKEEYGVTLSDKEASEKAIGLLQLFDSLTVKEERVQ